MVLEVLQPKTLEEVKSYLGKYENSKVLAGGTDLAIGLRKEKVKTDYIINLCKVNELKKIEDLGDKVAFGSLVTFTDLKESDIVAENFGDIKDCADSMGSPLVRNMATIGGNVANAAPAADSIPCFMNNDAMLVIESPKGKREVKCEEYFNDYANKSLKADEIITSIVINKTKGYSGFYKLGKRNSLAISRLNAVISFELVANKVVNFKITLGAVGKFPFRLHKVEEMVEGKEVEYLFSREVLQTLEDIVYESIKTRASMPFKKEAIKGVYKEALRRALERGGIHHE